MVQSGSGLCEECNHEKGKCEPMLLLDFKNRLCLLHSTRIMNRQIKKILRKRKK